MANGDLYEVSDVQTMYGQEVANVYFYEQTGVVVGQTVTSAQLLAEAFNEQIVPNVAFLQTADVVHKEIRVRNLFNAADKFTLPISEPGTAVGSWEGATQDALPSFVQMPFRLASSSGDVGDGSKHYAGISEGGQLDGVVTTPGLIVTADSLCDQLVASITPASLGLSVTDLFSPRLVKRIRSGSPGAYEYRLPENAAEATFASIAEAVFVPLLSHIISRAIGVGI